MGQKATQKQLRRNIMHEDKEKWRRIFNRIYLFLLTMLSFGMVVLFQTSLFRGGWMLVLIAAIVIYSQTLAWLDMDDAYKGRRMLAACGVAVLWVILITDCCYITYADSSAFQTLAIPSPDGAFPPFLTCFKYFWKWGILAGVIGGIFQHISGSLFALLMFLLFGSIRLDSNHIPAFGFYHWMQIMLAKTALFIGLSDCFGYAYSGGGKIAALFFRHRSTLLVIICFVIIHIISVLEGEFFYQRDKWHNRIFWINAIEFMIGTYLCQRLYLAYSHTKLKAGYEIPVMLGCTVFLTFIYYGIAEIYYQRKKKFREDLTYAIWHVRKFPEDED